MAQWFLLKREVLVWVHGSADSILFKLPASTRAHANLPKNAYRVTELEPRSTQCQRPYSVYYRLTYRHIMDEGTLYDSTDVGNFRLVMAMNHQTAGQPWLHR